MRECARARVLLGCDVVRVQIHSAVGGSEKPRPPHRLRLRYGLHATRPRVRVHAMRVRVRVCVHLHTRVHVRVLATCVSFFFLPDLDSSDNQ